MPSTREDTMHGYITDMLALEEHIGEAVSAQAKEYEGKYVEVGAELRKMHVDIERHVRDMKAITARHEGAPAQKVGDAVKRAASVVAGLGAAAVDLVRTEKLPKNLRDDFTAFSLASIGYLMLHTTALALERADVALLAEQHSRDYAAMLQTLQRLIPGTVIDELQSMQLAPKADVTATVADTLRSIWQRAT